MQQGRREEALKIYRWFRPLLDLDVSTYLVQNLKLVEAMVTGTTERVRMPRQPLAGARRKAVEKIVNEALASRPKLPKL
jgi:4-hydroxy-tetrahydrodipicolinate synthase